MSAAALLTTVILALGQVGAPDPAVPPRAGAAPRAKGKGRRVRPPPPPVVEETPPPAPPVIRGPERDPPPVEAPVPVAPAPIIQTAEGEQSVVVMPLEAKTGVLPDLAEQVTNALVASLAETKGFKVVSFREVQGALSSEAMKMTAGCDSVSCAAEIAGALNTDFIIIGTLAKVETEYVLNVSRVRARDAAVPGRSLRRFPQKRESLMLLQMPLVTSELMGTPVPPEVLARQKLLESQTPKEISALPWVLRTVAGVGATGAVVLVLAVAASAAVPAGITLYNWRAGPVLPGGQQNITQGMAMLSNMFFLAAVAGGGLVLVSAATAAGLLGASFAVPQ